MSVIIRLQNLPWSANALDIRQYFHGLSIPEGGVHIVGGEQGDAFIAFSTDEDARQAFLRSNGRIKEVQITLMLSSRTEMQKVIEQARSQSYAAFMAPQPTPAQVQPLPAVVPQIVPAPVPDLREKKEESGSSSSGRDSDRKRDKKRSRSKSRERKKDRSKDRKDSRRHRDKSRSRSRDRRDRRRRDRSRSRSRNRSRSRDRDSSRRSRDKNGSKKISDKGSNNTINFQGPPKKQMPEIWANRPQPDIIPPVVPQAPSLLGNFAVALDQAPRAFDPLPVGLQNVNGFPMGSPNMTNFLGNNRNSPRDSWPPQQHNQNQNNFNNRNSDDFSGNNRDRNRGERDIRDTRPIRGGLNNRDNFNTRDGNHQQEGKNRFQKRDFNQRDAREGKGDFGDRQQDSPINTCVSMEPFYGSYGDVRRFFSGLFISFRGIKIINDHNGHRTGVCYVQFATQSQKDEALRKNHQELNGIGVEIHHIDDEEFIEAIDRYNPVMDEYNKPGDRGEFKSRNITKYFNNTGSPVPDVTDSTCLKLEDLPSYVKEQDILHIFALHPLISMHLINKPRVGHVAYAKFSSKEVARQALEERGNHIIGGKPITVSPCREEEFEEINKEHEQAIDDVKQPSPMLISDCLVVENIPQAKVNDRDISDFFSEVGAIPTKIHIMSNNLGFTGQVYCEFQTPEEAVKAAKKDNTMLGASKITVSPIAREEMASVLNQVLPGPPLQSTLQPPPVRPQLPIVQPPRNTHQQPPQQRPFFRPRGAPGDQNNGPPPRMFGFRGGPGGPRGGGGPRFGPRAPGGPRHRFQQQQQQPHNNGGDDNAMPGCTVYMDNVPYKAGTNDILDFFEGYNCSNNVSRRYNPNNTPSAEAKVMFHNADDAYRAVQDLSGRKLWDRTIHLEQS